MATLRVSCPDCKKEEVVKYGFSSESKQRYRCNNYNCKKKTFILDYTNKGWLLEVRNQIIKMAINGSGMRDTVRVLGVGINTVTKVLKKNQ